MHVTSIKLKVLLFQYLLRSVLHLHIKQTRFKEKSRFIMIHFKTLTITFLSQTTGGVFAWKPTSLVAFVFDHLL